MSKIRIRKLIVKIFYKKIIFLILFFTIEVSNAEQNYQWVKISPNSWDNKYSKVRSLAFFDQKLCAGLGDASFGDADIYCYSFKKRIWTQIGGDGLYGGWKNHNKVSTLLSHQDKLFAGLGENVAGLYVKEKEKNWLNLVPLIKKKYDKFKINDYYYVYSSSKFKNLSCFGFQGIAGLSRDTNKGPDIFCFDKKLDVTKITGPEFEGSWTASDARLIYDMIEYDKKLIVTTGFLNPRKNKTAEVWSFDGHKWSKFQDQIDGKKKKEEYFLAVDLQIHKNRLYVSFAKYADPVSKDLYPKKNITFYSKKSKKWRFIDKKKLDKLDKFPLVNSMVSFKDELILFAGGLQGGGGHWHTNYRI